MNNILKHFKYVGIWDIYSSTRKFENKYLQSAYGHIICSPTGQTIGLAMPLPYPASFLSHLRFGSIFVVLFQRQAVCEWKRVEAIVRIETGGGASRGGVGGVAIAIATVCTVCTRPCAVFIDAKYV